LAAQRPTRWMSAVPNQSSTPQEQYMRVKRLFAVVWFAFAASGAHAAFTENFDDISTLAAAGWVLTNDSAPPGEPWFQGNDGVFASESGAADSYIAANYLSSNDANGLVSNW